MSHVCDTVGVVQIQFRFARSARRHRISKGRAWEAMQNAVLVAIDNRADGRAAGIFVGTDSRGLELEIGIGGNDDDSVIWAIIHVMPYRYSKHQQRK